MRLRRTLRGSDLARSLDLWILPVAPPRPRFVCRRWSPTSHQPTMASSHTMSSSKGALGSVRPAVSALRLPAPRPHAPVLLLRTSQRRLGLRGLPKEKCVQREAGLGRSVASACVGGRPARTQPAPRAGGGGALPPRRDKPRRLGPQPGQLPLAATESPPAGSARARKAGRSGSRSARPRH